MLQFWRPFVSGPWLASPAPCDGASCSCHAARLVARARFGWSVPMTLTRAEADARQVAYQRSREAWAMLHPAAPGEPLAKLPELRLV